MLTECRTPPERLTLWLVSLLQIFVNIAGIIRKHVEVLGAEVSTPPKTQLPENPTDTKLLFNLTISALALLLITGIGLSLRQKNPK